MTKAIFGTFLALVSFFAFNSYALAWTMYPYIDIGYTNSSYGANPSHTCSYWCQQELGYRTAPNVLSTTYAPQNYVPTVGTTYVGDNRYARNWAGAYVPEYLADDGYYNNYISYNSNYRPAVLVPNTNLYGAVVSGYYPVSYYVGPRGGNNYATSGYYPYVASSLYWGY